MVMWLLLFVLSFIFFIAVDLIWLGGIMREFYHTQLKTIGRFQDGALAPDWPSALAVWALLVLGIILFVLPRVVTAPYTHVFFWGALYGLVVYGVYDLTNYATLAAWPLSVVWADILWGMVLNGIVSCFVVWLYRLLF